MIKISKLEKFRQIIHLFATLCAPVSKKEVVDSRVESRVGNLIACYSVDFSQINVIFAGGGGIYKHVLIM